MFKSLFKFNDRVRVVYFIIMLLALFAPSFFFQDSFNYYKIGVLAYIAGYVLLRPKIKRHDISNNFGKWGFISLVILVTLLVLNPVKNDGIQFQNIYVSLIWWIFVVGLSETYIMVGLYQRIRNPLLTVIIMGLFHATPYMLMTGNYAFDLNLLQMVFKAMVGFLIFLIVYKQSNDVMTTALLHGLYDFVIV